MLGVDTSQSLWLYNIVLDVTYDAIDDARLDAVKPVKEEYFEVAAEEEAIRTNG